MRLREAIARILERDRGAAGPLAAIVFVSIVRMIGEYLVGRPLGLQTQDVLPTSLVAAMAQILSFYTLAFLLFAILVRFVLGCRPGQAAVPASIGLGLGVLPPILDGLFFGHGAPVMYGYGSGPDWLFLSTTIPPGEAMAIWASIAFTGAFVILASRSIARAVIATAGAYVVMQFLGVWVSDGISAVLSGSPVAVKRLAFFGLVLLVWAVPRARALLPSLLRVNHALPLALIALAGALWARRPWDEALGLSAAILVATLILIVQNDWFDRADDAAGGRSTTVTADDAAWLWFLSAVGILTMMLWSQVAAWILVAYVSTAALYHLPGLRLKRIFCVSYKLEGLWGMCAFLMGAVGAPALAEGPVDRSLLWPALLAFGGQTLVSGLKDWKDVKADDAANVHTYYTLASRAGRDPSRTHRKLVVACLAALLAPPLVILALKGFHPLVLVLAALSIPPMACVLLLKNRSRAVEGMFWLLCPYLFMLALAMGVMSPLDRIEIVGGPGSGGIHDIQMIDQP